MSNGEFVVENLWTHFSQNWSEWEMCS